MSNLLKQSTTRKVKYRPQDEVEGGSELPEESVDLDRVEDELDHAQNDSK